MSADPLLQELSQVADALSGALRPQGADRLLTSIAETARRLLGARACSLALLTDEQDELVYTTATGDGAAAVTGLRMPAGRGIAGWVVQSGQPVAVSDVRNDPRFAPDVAQSTGYVPESIVAAPVVSSAGVLGVLSVLDRDASRPGSEADLLLLQAFCEQAAIALETDRAHQRISELLLRALSDAAARGSDLAAALSATQAAPQDRMHEVAALLARLASVDASAQDLAVRVLQDVLSFVEQREASRPAG